MSNTSWNSSDKSANVTISGSNLIATASGATAWVRAVDRQVTGKFYWEVKPTVLANANTGAGFCPAGLVTPNGSSAAGMCAVFKSGNIWVAGSNTGSTLSARAANDIIGIAVDIDAQLVWFRVTPSGNWNGNASADPATATGGIAIGAVISAGIPAYPLAVMGANLDSITANFGDSAFNGTAPSGFTSGFTTGTPSVNELATQAAVEQWTVPIPDMQSTQAAIEEWASAYPNINIAGTAGTGGVGSLTTNSYVVSHTTFPLSGSRAGIGSAVIADSGSGTTDVLAGIGVEIDPIAAGSARLIIAGVGGTGQVGGLIMGPYTQWNPSDKTAITLSNSNLTATATGNNAWVRAIDKQFTGKFYFEITCTTFTNASSAVGIAASWASLTAGIGGARGTCGVNRNGALLVDGTSYAAFGAITSGTLLCFAFDADARSIWVRIGSGGNWNASATANPATGGGGVSSNLGDGIPAYPFFFGNGTSESVTADFGASSFTGTVPSGFTSGWPSGAAPAVSALDTQSSVEEWITTDPPAQVTQIATEEWASVPRTAVALTGVAATGGVGSLSKLFAPQGYCSTGLTNLGGTGNAGASSIYVCKVTSLTNATVDAVVMNFPGSVSSLNFRVLIYDSTPSVLLASGPIVTSVVAGYNRFPLSSLLNVTSGTTYYVGYICNQSLSVTVQSGGVGVAYYVSGGQNANSPPNPISGGIGQPNYLAIGLEFASTTAQLWGFGPDYTSNVALSSSNTVATISAGGASRAARSVVTHAAPEATKRYAEVTVSGTPSSTSTAVAVCSVNFNLTTNSSYAYVESWSPNGSIQGTTALSSGVTYASGDTISVAYDTSAQKVWFRKNGGTWIGNGASPDPATGTSGIAVNPGNWPMMIYTGDGASSATPVFTLRDTSNLLLYSPPSGYTSWSDAIYSVNPSISGVAGTGAVGSPHVSGITSSTLTGVSGTGGVGNLRSSIRITVSGTSATGHVGTLTLVITGAAVTISLSVTSLQLTPVAFAYGLSLRLAPAALTLMPLPFAALAPFDLTFLILTRRAFRFGVVISLTQNTLTLTVNAFTWSQEFVRVVTSVDTARLILFPVPFSHSAEIPVLHMTQEGIEVASVGDTALDITQLSIETATAQSSDLRQTQESIETAVVSDTSWLHQTQQTVEAAVTIIDVPMRITQVAVEVLRGFPTTQGWNSDQIIVTPSLPVLPGLAFNVKRTLTSQNLVQPHISGKETRIGGWSQSIYQYELIYELLRDYPTFDEYRLLEAFWLRCIGRYGVFLFDDPDDDQVIGQDIAIGNGKETQYQLIRTLGDDVHPGWIDTIQAPRVVSAVYWDGHLLDPTRWQITFWDSNLPGVLSIHDAVPVGVTLTADFSYFWPVRFLEDVSTFEQFMHALWELKQLTFETIKCDNILLLPHPQNSSNATTTLILP